ncbi:methionine adenosyltransferase [Bacillus sp. A116_S68]|jgi:S-adenosylmethionine synthetase|nr:methionine adenosyltransferase [Bacillus sp. A116_S68]
MILSKERDIQFKIVKQKYVEKPFEIVERKGWGHPDTLADTLGEYLSVVYSKYTKEKYGAILHHNFDKVGIMGGRAKVDFGEGEQSQPIRILLNGRVSSKFGDEDLPIKDMLCQATYNFFTERYPMLDVQKDLRILWEVSMGASPGAIEEKEGDRHYWFQPRSLDDLPELKKLVCNDTSMGCSHAPYSPLESLILQLEEEINGEVYKQDKPWLGNDIKIMATRVHEDVRITMCVPQICIYVNNVEEYKDNLDKVRHDILDYCSEKYPNFNITLFINTRDKIEDLELYLTFTGSSIETGDEGFVGRGNRMGGVIAPNRPYTMEGISGKNPVYHTGKMYCVAANEIAWELYKETGSNADVFLIGQSGQLLTHPWKTIIMIEETEKSLDELERIVNKKLDELPNYTNKILKGRYLLS